MTIKEICQKHGLTQAALAKRFGIPLRTVEQWCAGRRQAPPYVVAMIEQILEQERAKCEVAKEIFAEIQKQLAECDCFDRVFGEFVNLTIADLRKKYIQED